ncbi:hypothetical protein K503DRAFT_865212 [Rhizopogon vinicolor AM-OR11-026]|uniref:F-box domain-containing protein n=1 Tax=Rhizopogon vinicolor AM-OR11-026 TaxID=1314800 RepID=A0A1B7N4F2_9AGAM|nr:hypothetical protein K503DRAFT_865212 [Rhizopogon vinicolor AM-OR11-026]
MSALPTEVLLHICTTIDGELKGSPDQRRDSRITIAALARTCRAFKEPALDVLWKNIDGIKPLISCLPQGVVGKTAEGKLALGRPLFADEWKLFEQYACRVHSFTIEGSQLNQISDEVVQAFVSTPSSGLLPNLRRLKWQDDRDRFVPLLRILLVPTIRSLTLRGYQSTRWDPSFTKLALLASIGARYPSVREFSCTFGSEGKSDVVSKAVCDWHELVHLQTGVLNTQALAHLASLPSLESLSFMSYDLAADTQPQSVPIFTSKLDAVSITVPSHSHLNQCLRDIRFRSCRIVSFKLYIDRGRRGPFDPSNLIISFSECFSPVLEQLIVETGDETYDEVLDSQRFAFSFDVIAPLLQFSRLTVLDLTWFCSLDVDDEALKYMAQAWPQLEELYFGRGPCYPPVLTSTSRTFTALVHLIKHCRHLHRIQMRFAACSIDTDIEPFSTTTANENLTFLDVGISPISNPIAVACQLHALLPNLTSVEYHEDEDSEPPLPFKEEWNQVEFCLLALTKSAEIREKRQAK